MIFEKKKIAIVLTCFNRKKKTETALSTLLSDINEIEYHIFLCDDGSTDGTSDKIRELWEDKVTIIAGSGQLFWAKGMACALKEAEKYEPDFYLMINDDVEFSNNALDIMIDSYSKLDNPMIAITGATKSANGECTYGGSSDENKGQRWVLPTPDLNKCELANWNCFLIAKELYQKVGKIDDYYEHSYADYDYSNRIYTCGGMIVVAYDYIGICERNAITGTWMDRSLGIKERIQKLHKRNGLPIKSQIHYYRKFQRKNWVAYVIKPYLIILKDLFIKKR